MFDVGLLGESGVLHLRDEKEAFLAVETFWRARSRLGAFAYWCALFVSNVMKHAPRHINAETVMTAVNPWANAGYDSVVLKW
ncbi:hypothetical protein WM019_04290 [Bifidobacterium mongoliense]|uniref:hypothetical protein n=1 Tax=Bifidobacterium mongoliense TaxID=518643 RepID=UPI0005299E70|nr:hypothetical protein [Bifidobacterium mongoliense]